MRKIFNLTTNEYDIARYSSNAELKRWYGQFGFDGAELMDSGTDPENIVGKDDVMGVHMKYFYHWVCLWNGDEELTLKEYDSWETCREIFGGVDRDAIVKVYEKNLEFVRKYEPEYVVFHVCDVSIRDSITREFTYTDKQTIDAVIELVNTIFPKEGLGFTLLFENLWWSGLSMLEPELTDHLLKNVNYPKCGVMLDVGHLLHTNTSLRTEEEGIDYIYSVLDKYDNLDFIKGIHLHQTLNGEYVESVLKDPITLSGTYYERLGGIFGHIMKIDSHKPFVSDRIAALVEHISPEYLVFEIITSDRDEHERYLREQLSCFPEMS